MKSVFTYGADQPGKTDWAKNATIATGPSRLFGLTVVNKSGSDFYVDIFDLAAAPGGSEVPEFSGILVQAGLFTPFAFATGRKFSTGIYVRAVTTQGGSTAIPADSAKFTWDKMDNH